MGTKPPRIDAVKTLTGTAADVVVMDWGFSFTPNALVDANAKQLKNRVNERIVVKANVFGVTIPVAVDDVSFKGTARVRMRLMTSFPHVETVNVSLLEPPVLISTPRFYPNHLGGVKYWLFLVCTHSLTRWLRNMLVHFFSLLFLSN